MLTIGLSRATGSPKYENYEKWLRTIEPDCTLIDLSQVDDITASLEQVDGLILTGGGDIDPAEYGEEGLRDVCGGIDPERDTAERMMINHAIEQKMPLLGICRGLQMINVVLGGTLIADIPGMEGKDQRHSVREDGSDASHVVEIESGSLLSRATGEVEIDVNSSHHQGIGRLATGLAVSARADDGIIEGIEWQEPEQKNFMMAVQWHPERMDPASTVSRGILEKFLLECHSYEIYKRTTPPIEKPEPEEIQLREESGGENDRNGLLPIIQ